MIIALDEQEPETGFDPLRLGEKVDKILAEENL